MEGRIPTAAKGIDAWACGSRGAHQDAFGWRARAKPYVCGEGGSMHA